MPTRSLQSRGEIQVNIRMSGLTSDLTVGQIFEIRMDFRRAATILYDGGIGGNTD